MLKFIQVEHMNKNLKNAIATYLSLGIKFWKNFVSSEADMHYLIHTSNKIAHQKQNVSLEWKKLSRGNQENFRSPYLLYGIYSMLTNNGEEATKLIESYTNTALRAKKIN
jgi:hypothetical protein